MSAQATELAERQAAFMRAILDDGAPMPEGWGNSQAAGMAVYRGNYRSAIMDTLASSFERTASYVGEDAFRQASMHHAITHPPHHWTIEAVGEGFDQACAQLFSDNPEVAELAWLEWSMLEASRSADCVPLDPASFAGASAEFADADWAELKLTFLPQAVARSVEHDLAGIWRSLDEDMGQEVQIAPPATRGCIVWREGEWPTFLMVDVSNAAAFSAMQQGASYAEVVGLLAGPEPDEAPDQEAVQNAAMKAGEFLGLWLNEGLIASFQT
ncbi:MAG: DNA-binding domain-containing protein [Pseudomonadota bacterium]